MFGELGFHAVHVGGRQVALVDGDDDGFLGFLGVFDRLKGLRHDAVVGGDDEHDDVGDVRAAGAHVGENRVARGVEEGDFLVVVDDLIGADVLGDAAGFAGGDFGFAEEIEDGGFAVVHVAHDGDDGRAVLEEVFGFLDGGFRLLDDFLDFVEPFVLVAFFAFEGEAVDFTDFGGDFRFERLVGRGEDADFDQVRHDIERLEPEAGRQFGDEDRRLDDDQFRVVGDFVRGRSRLGRRRVAAGGARGRGLGALTMAGSSRSRILEIGAETCFAADAGFADFGFFFFGEEVEGLALGLVELAGARGGTTSTSLRWRSRREGFGVVSRRSRTLSFSGELSLCLGIRRVCGVRGERVMKGKWGISRWQQRIRSR